MTRKQLAEELGNYHHAMHLIGEICVSESKCHISAEDAIKKIRSKIYYSSDVTRAIIEDTLENDEEGDQ